MWRAASAFLPRVSRLCLQASAPKQIDPYVCALAACDVLLQDRSRVWSRWLPYVAAALALPQAAHMKGDEADESSRWQFLGLTSRRRVFFKYEKRIRELSAPDKVFDYFASVSQSGSRLMTPADLLHSLVAVYPPEDSKLERSGALKGDRHDMSAQLPEMIKESDFFQQFDTDGDGFISFGEYLLIVTFLAIALEDVHTIFSMFDDDDSGAISLAEFLHVTNSLQKRLRRVSRVQRTGLAANVGEEGHGMLISFFGPDGKGQLDLTHFRDFCIALHAELVRLEFLHYDDAEKGYIPGISFAHSLVSHTHMQEVDAYLTAVDSMPADLKNARVSWGDFKSFALLRQSVHRLAVALDFFFSTEGKICKHDFQHAVSKILGQGLPSILVDIIFSVYATEEGHLNYREFLYAIRRREGNNLYSKQMLGLDPTSKQSIFACLRSCILLED